MTAQIIKWPALRRQAQMKPSDRLLYALRVAREAMKRQDAIPRDLSYLQRALDKMAQRGEL